MSNLDNPISRNEKLLATMTGYYSGDLDDPQSRNEKILAKITGHYNGDLEDAQSNIEAYLLELAVDQEETIDEIDEINGEVI